ncbi:MAG TPA: hypothetical protein VHD38_03250 [Candidatus Paceibacterota bacterium]|nr:hypothetical protein [Candidatus Paceibacterota bacterium]
MAKPPLKQTPIEAFITWIGSVPSIIFHTILFIVLTSIVVSNIFQRDTVLLIWNTGVSLEAIYLAIFIQFSVNRNTASLREVEEDIDEIQEDVEELGEDVDEIQEDIEEMSEDVEEMQEDLEEMTEDEIEEEKREQEQAQSLDTLTADIRRILTELEGLKKKK